MRGAHGIKIAVEVKSYSSSLDDRVGPGAILFRHRTGETEALKVECVDEGIDEADGDEDHPEVNSGQVLGAVGALYVGHLREVLLCLQFTEHMAGYIMVWILFFTV